MKVTAYNTVCITYYSTCHTVPTGCFFAAWLLPVSVRCALWPFFFLFSGTAFSHVA